MSESSHSTQTNQNKANYIKLILGRKGTTSRPEYTEGYASIGNGDTISSKPQNKFDGPALPPKRSTVVQEFDEYEEDIELWNDYFEEEWKETKYPAIDVRNAVLPHLFPEHWKRICEILAQPITSTDGLCKSLQLIYDVNLKFYAESGYYRHYKPYTGGLDFSGLYLFIEEECEESEKQMFFATLLTSMQETAIQLAALFSDEPLLNLLPGGHRNKTIRLSRLQVACLIVNGFFGSIPKQPDSKHVKYPTFNFYGLFAHWDDRREIQIEKLRCFIQYFFRIMESTPYGYLKFSRRKLVDPYYPNWSSCKQTLCNIEFVVDGSIENDIGSLQIDFVNKRIGGGVLSHGAVQEEILFLIAPELVVSRLFTPVLHSNEALILRGAERFSDYDGYAETFEYAGSFSDSTPKADDGCIDVDIIAIDALNFSRYPWSFQYGDKAIKRELEKAFIGFLGWEPGSAVGINAARKKPVATGRWGCGAFLGDLELKFIIQLVAASVACRNIRFYMFGDEAMTLKCKASYERLVANAATTGDIWKALCLIGPYAQDHGDTSEFSVLDFVCAVCCND